MNTDFEIKVTTWDMYVFLMYHTYHAFSGIFSIVAGVALILFYFINRHGSISNLWIYLAFGIIFLIYQPVALYTRAAKQVKLGTSFKKPLGYRLSKEGIEVIQGDVTGQVTWDQVYRVRETGRLILVYTNARNAFIWVKAQMGSGEQAVKEMIGQYVPDGRKKLKK